MPVAILDVLGEPTFDPDNLPLGNQSDPLDELIYIIITTMTQHGAAAAYEAVKSAFPSWQGLPTRGAAARLRRLLRPCGLAVQKSTQLVAIAKQLNADFGEVTLEPLRAMDDGTAETYLLGLPRVGKKIARCVLMYSLGRGVLPVDAHVLRVSKRVGLLPTNASWAKAHDAIHATVPAKLRFGMHVALVTHGRNVCVARAPRCEGCSLMRAQVCSYGRSSIQE